MGVLQLLVQGDHLLPEGVVLLLQEARPDGDLVLLQPPRVPGPLGRHIVLPAPGPVPVVLLDGTGGGRGGEGG